MKLKTNLDFKLKGKDRIIVCLFITIVEYGWTDFLDKRFDVQINVYQRKNGCFRFIIFLLNDFERFNEFDLTFKFIKNYIKNFNFLDVDLLAALSNENKERFINDFKSIKREGKIEDILN